MKHLVFYDGECGFCDATVQVILGADSKRRFVFAPLQGETASKYLINQPNLLNINTVVLIENYETPDKVIYSHGKAVFRICWLLGGAWRLIGWISFLPSILYNWAYRLVAKSRHLLSSKDSCPLPDSREKDRFLP